MCTPTTHSTAPDPHGVSLKIIFLSAPTTISGSGLSLASFTVHNGKCTLGWVIISIQCPDDCYCNHWHGSTKLAHLWLILVNKCPIAFIFLCNEMNFWKMLDSKPLNLSLESFMAHPSVHSVSQCKSLQRPCSEISEAPALVFVRSRSQRALDTATITAVFMNTLYVKNFSLSQYPLSYILVWKYLKINKKNSDI